MSGLFPQLFWQQTRAWDSKPGLPSPQPRSATRSPGRIWHWVPSAWPFRRGISPLAPQPGAEEPWEAAQPPPPAGLFCSTAVPANTSPTSTGKPTPGWGEAAAGAGGGRAATAQRWRLLPCPGPTAEGGAKTFSSAAPHPLTRFLFAHHQRFLQGHPLHLPASLSCHPPPGAVYFLTRTGMRLVPREENQPQPARCRWAGWTPALFSPQDKVTALAATSPARDAVTAAGTPGPAPADTTRCGRPWHRSVGSIPRLVPVPSAGSCPLWGHGAGLPPVGSGEGPPVVPSPSQGMRTLGQRLREGCEAPRADLQQGAVGDPEGTLRGP